jgi:hypothetical protein
MNTTKQKHSVAERRSADKTKLLDQFRKMPIVQIAAERAAVSRATYYRWLEEDAEFRDEAMAAIAEGESFISDKSEGQLLALIGEKHFGAIKTYLEHHNDTYSRGKGLGGRPDRKIRVILLHDHED